MNRRGFTLIELLPTMSIIGVLASIALPKDQNLRQRATAAEVVANIRTLRLGAFQYNEASGTWPRTTGLGTVPGGVGPYRREWPGPAERSDDPSSVDRWDSVPVVVRTLGRPPQPGP